MIQADLLDNVVEPLFGYPLLGNCLGSFVYGDPLSGLEVSPCFPLFLALVLCHHAVKVSSRLFSKRTEHDTFCGLVTLDTIALGLRRRLVTGGVQRGKVRLDHLVVNELQTQFLYKALRLWNCEPALFFFGCDADYVKRHKAQLLAVSPSLGIDLLPVRLAVHDPGVAVFVNLAERLLSFLERLEQLGLIEQVDKLLVIGSSGEEAQGTVGVVLDVRRGSMDLLHCVELRLIEDVCNFGPVEVWNLSVTHFSSP